MDSKLINKAILTLFKEVFQIESPTDEMVKRLCSVLSELSPREERIIRLRYGIDDNIPRTLEEVANEFGVTREDIRQVEVKAIKKLRHPNRIKKIVG